MFRTYGDARLNNCVTDGTAIKNEPTHSGKTRTLLGNLSS